MWKDTKRNCEYCQKPLVFCDYLQALRKRFCNHSCAMRGQHQKKTKSPRVCNQCQMMYIPTHFAQKFCGRLCSSTNSHHKIRHDGNGALARERDKQTCRLCGKRELFRNRRSDLVSHHLDGTGEDNTPNHDIDNLVTLCRKCHLTVHRMEYRIIDGVVVLYNPLPKLIGNLPVRFAVEVEHSSIVR